MIGGMQNLEMLQAALQAATPEVTQPQQIQGPQQAGQQQATVMHRSATPLVAL
jgi:hypothetical protein